MVSRESALAPPVDLVLVVLNHNGCDSAGDLRSIGLGKTLWLLRTAPW
jgi:hypothetical protein